MDSGASNHMTPDAGNISLFRPPCSSYPSSVIVGNGSTLPVTSIGHTVLPGALHLNNVLVAPHIIKNLISVRQFTIDNRCSVEFDPFGLSVKDLRSRNVIARCNSAGPLYHLHFAESPSSPLSPLLFSPQLIYGIVTSATPVMRPSLGLLAVPAFDVTKLAFILSVMHVNWVVIFVCLSLVHRLELSRILI